jgi:hypothetical protein
MRLYNVENWFGASQEISQICVVLFKNQRKFEMMMKLTIIVESFNCQLIKFQLIT